MSTHELSLFSDQPPSFLTIGTGTQGRKSTPQPIVQRKVLDRCIIGFADPNAADVRPYMGATKNQFGHPYSWGLAYQSARGYRHPPPQGRSVLSWQEYGDAKPGWAKPMA